MSSRGSRYIRGISGPALTTSLLQGGKVFALSTFVSSILIGVFAYLSVNSSAISRSVGAQKWISFFTLSLILLIALVLYAIIVRAFKIFKRVRNSGRWDSILAVTCGVLAVLYISFRIPGVLAPLPFDSQNLQSLLILLIISTVGFFAIVIIKSRKNHAESFFLDDQPEEDERCDYLRFKEDAHIFAEQVLNGFSEKSIVFGLDAPWGAGKSTYLNFCKKYWEKQHPDKVAVFDFQPLYFIGASDIFDKFAAEFARTIKDQLYVPNFSDTFSKYVKMLKSIGFDFWGGKFSLDNGVSTLSAFDDLKNTLAALDRKIIVIIDDLDRLPLEDIKTMLDVVKKSFVLPNVTYVICYETENINAFGAELKTTEATANISGASNFSLQATSSERLDHAKIAEYFEKVINVKKTLVAPRENLKNYLISEIGKMATIAPDGESFNLLSPESLDAATAAIEKIFDPADYEKYVTYIGDLRKVKRLLNIVKMQVNNLNLDEIDINFYDLLNLFLIYINFPNIFRKIYITETGGARGFFSLTWNYNGDAHRSSYKNSKEYKDYIASLSSKERFLIEKIFSENRFADSSVMNTKGKEDIEDPKVRANSAAFNGGLADAGKNLEDYLNLIVKNEKPLTQEAYNFHFKNVRRLINGERLQTIFEDPRYNLANGEKTRMTFLRILTTNLDKVPFATAQVIIDDLLDDAKTYAATENGDFDIGLRHNLDMYLVMLLDKRGWQDKDGDSVENTDDNVKEIAKRVFGEDPYVDKGVLDKLSESSRGIAGIYDLIAFRLFCSQDRGGQFYNLYRSLSIHADAAAPNQGPIRDILIQEMREISQKVFAIFKERYITPGKNIFEEAAAMTDEECFAGSLEYVRKAVEEKHTDIEVEKEKIRARLLTLIIFQMTNNIIDMGIGTGFYDETGTGNASGINGLMNQYLFGICFNIDEGHPIKNAEFFVNFLLMNFGSGVGRRGFEYLPSEGQYFRFLDKDSMVAYWQKNSEKIKSHLANRKDIIYSPGYSASYSEDLPKVYSLLDGLIAQPKENPAVENLPAAQIVAELPIAQEEIDL